MRGCYMCPINWMRQLNGHVVNAIRRIYWKLYHIWSMDGNFKANKFNVSCPSYHSFSFGFFLPFFFYFFRFLGEQNPIITFCIDENVSFYSLLNDCKEKKRLSSTRAIYFWARRRKNKIQITLEFVGDYFVNHPLNFCDCNEFWEW